MSATWLVGFRPFFLLALAAGAGFAGAWGAIFSGHLAPPPSPLPPLTWHAHELLFGFGWAVLGGFLLTATKTWVKIRGVHGRPLQGLVVLWLLERAVASWGGALPWPLVVLGLFAYEAAVIATLVGTLWAHRANDSFRRDNVLFLVGLPLFLVAKALLLAPQTFVAGWTLAVALIRLAMVVMLERTLVQFMKAHFGLEVPRRRWVDDGIKGLALVGLLEPVLPDAVAALVLGALGVLLLGRFFTWGWRTALQRLDVAIMFLGGLGLVAHLVLAALARLGWWQGLGNVAVHAFTVGCMGLIVPAMLARIAMGHTGRKIAFTLVDKAALWVLVAAATVRLGFTQWLPAQYATWILVSGLGWTVGLTLLLVRLAPLLVAPRVDGREV